MIKFVKKIALVFGVIAVLLVIAASSYLLTDKAVCGIENYKPADCSLSLTAHLFPSDNFLQDYNYLEGDYSYRYDGGITQHRATAIAMVRYEPDVYHQAKETCLKQFSLCDRHCFTIEEYYFAEHLCHTKETAQGTWEVSCKYPRKFNMFAFNDANYSLIFLGYYCSNENDEVTLLAESNFEAFLPRVFKPSELTWLYD